MFQLLRLPGLFIIINPRNATNIIKAYYKGQIKRTLSNDDYKQKPFTDFNKIMMQIMIGYVFRILRLAVIVVLICYFSGTLFYLFCWQLYLDYYQDT